MTDDARRVKLKGGSKHTGHTIEMKPDGTLVAELYDFSDDADEALGGDVAWGGNWFFLTDRAPCDLVLANAGELTLAATSIRDALAAQGVSGKDGASIDHIEIVAPPRSKDANSRNFVLCPGGAYDRSPCGTGTSAKLACLYADGKLRPGVVWVQESLIGSRFRATFELGRNGGVIPRIEGRAFICAESTLLLDPADPFRHGFGHKPA